ncbi:ABC-type dipeptide/oligopeptide/nickel transport system permease component, partial [Rhizobium wenxiniae]
MSTRRPSMQGALGQIGTILVTLLGLLVLTFIIGRMMPADPVRAMVGEDATRETYEQVFRSLGLDRPLWEQFFYYLGDVLTGNFGTSIRTGQPVIQDILHVMPATIELATFAILIGAGLGVPMGVIAAVNKDRWPDHVVRVL